MSEVLLELALKKQRLQLQSAAQRAELAGHALAMEPLFEAGDRVREGVRWLRRHPQVLVAAAVAVLVARPRGVWRWTRRGIVAWRIARKAQDWLATGRSA